MNSSPSLDRRLTMLGSRWPATPVEWLKAPSSLRRSSVFVAQQPRSVGLVRSSPSPTASLSDALIAHGIQEGRSVELVGASTALEAVRRAEMLDASESGHLVVINDVPRIPDGPLSAIADAMHRSQQRDSGLRIALVLATSRFARTLQEQLPPMRGLPYFLVVVPPQEPTLPSVTHVGRSLRARPYL